MNSCTIILLSLISVTLAANCYGPASKLIVTEFNAFPSPASVGETIFIRANLAPTYDMGDAQVHISVFMSDKQDVSGLVPVLDLTGLPFCHFSTSISCPLQNGSHILSWEYTVPDILPGTYQVKYEILEISPPENENPYSCIQFPITITSKTQPASYTSWYQATLIGNAIFSDDKPHAERVIGDHVQVGPEGPLNNTKFSSTNYGIIKFLKGSGDLVPNPYYDTSNFVWGLNGIMVKQDITGGLMSHIYTGHCFLGYINADKKTIDGNYYNYTSPLIEGDFWLNWTYANSNTALINGYATFANATLPYGWGYPLLYGRLGRHQIAINDEGFLVIQASACTAGDCKVVDVPQSSSGSSGLSSDKLGLAIGLPIAVVFLVVLIVAALLFLKRRRESEQEDGIFAVARKPEYGSALVVDDIIEETRGRALQDIIDIRDEDEEDEPESGSESELERRHGRSRTPASRSVSRSQSYSRSRSRSVPDRRRSDSE